MSIWDDERAYIIEHFEESARAAGLGAVWDQAVSEDHGASTLILGTLGAVSRYIVETGLALEPATP